MRNHGGTSRCQQSQPPCSSVILGDGKGVRFPKWGVVEHWWAATNKTKVLPTGQEAPSPLPVSPATSEAATVSCAGPGFCFLPALPLQREDLLSTCSRASGFPGLLAGGAPHACRNPATSCHPSPLSRLPTVLLHGACVTGSDLTWGPCRYRSLGLECSLSLVEPCSPGLS